MAGKKKDKAKEELQHIRTLADVNESYFIGLMWANPVESYAVYSNRLDSKDFLHKQWGFFFGLGQRLFQKGLRVFDEISVHATVAETGCKELFDEYGGLDTLDELILIVKNNPQNIESYYDSILKNKVISSLMGIVGAKVILEDGNYDYREMNAREIATYWQYKMNSVAVEGVANYDSENMYITADQFLANLEEQEGNMIPFYRSNMLNNTVQGIPRGEVTMIGGFGNSGKSSFMVDKVLVAFVHSDDKTLVILNEEGGDKLREKLFLSLINHVMRTKENPISFPRWKLNKVSSLSDDERQIIYDTFEKWHEIIDGEEAKIKIVFMEQYKIDDLKNIVALHANLGYVNLVIDTHKVPDGYQTNTRWEAIVEATKEIYKMSRPESGGYNLRTVLTIQLAASHIGDRFLGYDAIGEGKAMKNEASILMMYRPLFTDEYDKLEVRHFRKNDLSGGKYVKEIVDLDKSKTYYVMFIPKNRFGGNTDSGQDCILFEPNFDFNSFREVGYVKIDRNYA